MAKRYSEVGILLVRIMLGFTMGIHGVSKITDLNATIGFFSSLGIPSIMTWLVILLEIVGGILMIIGVLVPIVAVGFIIEIGTAMVLLGFQRGYVGGIELEVIIIVLSISMILTHWNKKIINLYPVLN
ncbi:hypothetical protein A5819_000923 [Enterococcus sp. 7E2_DIV0204]|uniref:DoxX family protein n=1 Tax=Candidatus Enterococcus lemimoniae TaxID=1834167 RepID=A0ABZ2T7V8_9ENTE|nr:MULTISPECIES: DoxX family protein [unclassified Enterococcus]OTN88442.1 hypothetical protein A5819_000923 [Enterococcus sp. 7E2_DIV0204]OTO70629.1 hypothetical protein A5866_002866 [Enterococcus sp. 12C11_DIV0727]OTP50915.1 hypothetical protein A5884_000101 [Enterococcus sp. 7D2_DIV0200]